MVASFLPRCARSRVEYRVGHIAYRAIREIMFHSCDQSKFRGADIVGNVLARFGQDQSVDIPMENNGRYGNPAQAFATADTKAYAAFADFTYAATDAPASPTPMAAIRISRKHR